MLVLPETAVTSAGREAAELASVCGLDMDPWQRFVLDGAMGERSDGKWASAEVDLLLARQNGKNAVVEVRELYGLVMLGESIIHTAHLFKTTRESYNRLLGLVEADPDVAARLTHKVASPASGYEMRFRGGGRITFIARSRSSGRGLTGDLLVLDEAQDLSDDALGALLPVISARSFEGNPQVWYQGSAPGPTSEVWHRRRKLGRSGGSPGCAYFEFSADPDAELDDRTAWAEANPGLGVRISVAAIEKERRAMSDEMFARERLSLSPDLLDVVDDVAFPSDAWEAACAGDYVVSEEDGLVFAVAATPERTSASIAVSDGTTVELLEQRDGVGWAADRIVEMVAKRPGTVAIDPKSAAGSLIDELERRGVDVEPVTGADVAHACGAFYDAVMAVDDETAAAAPRVQIRRDPRLDAAAAVATKRTSGDAWVWDRKADKGDITPLDAATLAFHAALTGAASAKPIFAY